MTGPAELDEPAVARDAADDRGREPVAGEDRAPPAGPDVGREYHAPPLVALGDHLTGKPRPVHAGGHAAELVGHQRPSPRDVTEQPAERPLAPGPPEPRHELRGLPEPHRAARRRRGNPERGGHVGLPAPRLVAGHEAPRVAHERGRAYALAAPAVGERHVRPAGPLDRLRHGEPRPPGQARPPRPVAVRGLRPGRRRAGRDLPGRRGGEEGGDGVAGYEERPGGDAEGRLCGPALRARLRHGGRPPRAGPSD